MSCVRFEAPPTRSAAAAVSRLTGPVNCQMDQTDLKLLLLPLEKLDTLPGRGQLSHNDSRRPYFASFNCRRYVPLYQSVVVCTLPKWATTD